MTKRSLICGAAVVCALAGCSSGGAGNANAGAAGAAGSSGGQGGGTTEPTAQPPIARAALTRTPSAAIADGSLQGAVSANNALAIDLYGRLLAGSSDSNLLTSPISASLALTMAYAGAVGNTATEMALALHFDPSLGSAIFDGQNALSQALTSRGSAALARAKQDAESSGQPTPVDADYDLHIVNSVWGEKTYTWEAPFLATLAQSYGTGVYQEDFRQAFEPARLAINSWVSTETKHKINDLLPEMSLDDSTRMVLVNALHLKFPWAAPFLPANTTTGPFTRANGVSVNASFMNQSGTFSYLDDSQAQIVALPLSHGELSLIIALPHEGVDLSTYEASLAAGSAALSAPTTNAFVQLSLPKAEFTSKTFSLAKPLQDMGMKSAFTPGTADFSGLCAHPPDGDRLYVADVLQKAMISMQETGVEAAAATAVLIAGTSAYVPPPTPVPMTVDRPYLLALVDGPTGAIVMLGHVVDPTDQGSL